jgi:hypothetical protein
MGSKVKSKNKNGEIRIITDKQKTLSTPLLMKD